MQNKRIKSILDNYNCEVAFIEYNRIAFRYKGKRYYIFYDNKRYCIGDYNSRYEERKYISDFKQFKEFKLDLVKFLSY